LIQAFRKLNRGERRELLPSPQRKTAATYPV
jgi:hypothetical protein